MSKELLNDMEKMEKAQSLFLGFLIEFKNYYLNFQYTNAVDLLREEIKNVKRNELLKDYDSSILEFFEDLKEYMIEHTNDEVIDKVQKEIDILSTDISISNS